MADIAEIGFKADTSQLKDAQTSLEALAPAAQKAERASDALNTSLSETGTAAQKAAAGLKAEATAADAAAAGTVKNTKAANDNAHAHQGMSTQAMAMQHSLRSSIEMMAMGIPPTQILGSQMNHLIFAMSGEGGVAGAAKALGSSLAGLLNPTNLLGIGIFALVLSLISAADWASMTKSALNEFADILPTIAPYLVIIGGAMLIAFSPAIIGMITAISEAVLGLTARLIGLALGWVLANPGTAFIAGIALVLVALNIFRNEITQAFGVDVIGVVKDAANAVIGAFVGAFAAIVATWRQFPAALGDFAFQAANALISTVQNAINKTIDAMRGLWNWIADHDPTGTMKHNNDKGGVDLGQLPNPYAGAGDAMKGQAKAAYDAAQGTDYVGKAYTAIGNAASGAAQKVRDLAKSIGEEDAASKKKKGGKTEEQKFDDIVSGADNTIAKLKAERDAIGLTAEAAAELKYQTQLLNEARQKGIDLTPTQRATLMSLAEEMAKLEVATKKAKDALDFSKGLVKGFVSDLEQGLKNGESFWKSFGDAALNALNKIVDKLLNDVINALFEVQSASGGSSSGGGLFGMIGKLFGFANGGAFNGGVQQFASGGTFTNKIVNQSTLFRFANGGAMGEMGEAGPEAIVPLKRMGNGDLGVQTIMPKGNDNNGPGKMELNVNVSGARGNSEIKEMVKQGVQQGIEQYDNYALPGRVNEIASDRRVR